VTLWSACWANRLADSLLKGSDMAAKMSADDMLALLQEERRGDF